MLYAFRHAEIFVFMIIIVCGLKLFGKSYIFKNLKKIMKALVYDEYTDNDDFSKILKIKDHSCP